ncbi:hypothetical protein C5F48_24635, partial [Cereibacter changlensis JA139]
DGFALILGDLGSVLATGGVLTSVSSIVAVQGAKDTITTGDGEAWVFGGEGNDTITDGEGAAVILGDLGRVTLADGIIVRVEATEVLRGGDDLITTG